MPWEMPYSVRYSPDLAEMPLSGVKPAWRSGKDTSKGSRNIFWGNRRVPYPGEKQCSGWKRIWKNPLSYDPRICTSLTKAIVLVLLVHKCPKMNFACREHKRNITSKYILFFWSICYCNTLQNVNNFAKGKHSPDTNINAILFA